MSYSTVDCWEIDNTASSGINADGATASVTLGCLWANRVALQQDLYGNRNIFPGFAGTGAPRVLSVNNVRGIGARTVRAGTNNQVFDYEEAHLDVEYGPLQAEAPSGPDPGYDLIVESFQTNYENIRLDHSKFKWAATRDTRLVPGEAPVRQLRRLTLVREYIGMTAIPTDVLSLIGYVNDGPYTSSLLGLTFATETLLFGEPSASRTIRTDGDSGWNLTLSFDYFAPTWNKFWAQETSQYEEIIWDGAAGNYKNYPLGDFSNLFQ